MLLNFKYDNNDFFLNIVPSGYGNIEWPEEVLSGLLDCAGEMTHSLETELKECDGAKTGTIQVVIRLQPKCEEYV